MTFTLLDPTTKKIEKSIREEERKLFASKLIAELHIMKTAGVTCHCDRCIIVNELINKIIK